MVENKLVSKSRNPYVADDGNPVLRHSAFAFMDILGYADLIIDAKRNNTQQALLQRLHKALTEGRAWLNNPTVLDAEEKRLWGSKDSYVLKAFTDNIVIAWPIKGDAEGELGSLFFKLMYFQLVMSMHGFFIRGAISIGDAYIDDLTVFGDALTQAYLGENTQARDPRIILTASAVAAVKQHLTYYARPEYAPQVSLILCDADGQWFLNYLDSILGAVNESGPFYQELLKHKKAVETKLGEFKNNPPIFSKYIWVANYHNFYCDQHSEFFSKKHRINSELLRANPKSIADEHFKSKSVILADGR